VIKAVLFSGGIAWIFVKIVTLTFGLIALIRLLPGPNRQVPYYRPRPMRATMLYGGGIVALAGLVAECAILANNPASHPVTRSARVSSTFAIGMFAPGVATSHAPERSFATATGARPVIVLSYSSLRAPFDIRFARLASAYGATPFIQLMPGNLSMRSFASGREDARLRAYAALVKAYKRPVMLSFAPEANGNWYRWGWSHTSPAVWVAAWRHVVTVFRSLKARNAIWVWTVNISFPHSGPVADYWPGDAYVEEVGIDGYFVRRSDTFTALFSPVLGAVRHLTDKPVILSETAVGPVAGALGIRRLFAGASANHMAALVWFNQAQHGGIHHQDWRLQDSPAMLAAFRTAVKEYA
jgi:hypothetical protein